MERVGQAGPLCQVFFPSLELKKWGCRCGNLPEIVRRVKENIEEFLTWVSDVLTIGLVFCLFGAYT